MRKEKIFNMAQQKKLSFFLLFVIVLQNIDNAELHNTDNTKCTEGIEVPVTLYVEAEYTESSVREALKHTTEIQTSSSFKSNYKNLAVSASVSGSGAIFSGAASASYEAVTDSALETSGSSHKEDKTKTIYDPEQNQITRKILIAVTIDGFKAQTITSEIVFSVNEKESLSPEKLRELAEDYISYTYGHIDGGLVTKNTYEATTCVEVDPYELVEKGSECKTTGVREQRKTICYKDCTLSVNRDPRGIANCFQLFQADSECATPWFEVGLNYCACYTIDLPQCEVTTDEGEDLYKIKTV